MPEPAPPLRVGSFGIKRMLSAVAAVALAFAGTRHLGWLGIAVRLLIAVPVTLIVLIARRHQLGSIVRLLAGAGLGLCLGGLPQVDDWPGDQVHRAIAGTIIGCLFAVTINYIKRSESPKL